MNDTIATVIGWVFLAWITASTVGSLFAWAIVYGAAKWYRAAKEETEWD